MLRLNDFPAWRSDIDFGFVPLTLVTIHTLLNIHASFLLFCIVRLSISTFRSLMSLDLALLIALTSSLDE